MMLRLVLLATSFAAAFGNYGFLLGLNSPTNYMFSLSISSCIAGVFCYGFLPNLLQEKTPANILSRFLLLGVSGALILYFMVSNIASMVFVTIFLFMCSEIVLASRSQWKFMYSLRFLMLLTGVFSWLVSDLSAIGLRMVLITLPALGFLAIWARMPKPSDQKELPQKSLLILVFTNLTWVYLLPLIAVLDPENTQKLGFYIVTTITPLIYFKAQDVIFKADILGQGGNDGKASFVFLLVFAVPLALFYLSIPVLLHLGVVSGNAAHIWAFSLVSLMFLSLNIFLTNALSTAK